MMFFSKKEESMEEVLDKELQRLAEYNETKRKQALNYLGNKWIMKGGEYHRSNTSLGRK
jgi:hypothetical protein